MAKKRSASSRPARLISMRSGDIGNKKLSKKQIAVLTRVVRAQEAGDDSGIDYSEIPPLTDAQLKQMVRLREVKRKIPVSVRLDPTVLAWLKSKGDGHLTRINDILANLMEAER